MTFQIIHNDITMMNTDAIVNAANSGLRRGSGVCGAIFEGADDPGLKEECDILAPCKMGEAVITKGYNLNAKYIIHTVGPIWQGGDRNEGKILRNAYKNSLELAKKHDCKSISFPLISSGVYGYPKSEALDVAVSTIKEFIMDNDMEVNLVVYDKKSVTLGEELTNDLIHYIDKYYDEDTERRYNNCSYKINLEDLELDSFDEEFNKKEMPEYLTPQDVSGSMSFDDDLEKSQSRKLADILKNPVETFTGMLFRLIDEKDFTDVEVYKRANIDRKLFSKIRSNNDYTPKKQTIIALAISLRLSLDEAKDLLGKAGFAFTDNHKSDVIVMYFFEKEDYDIFKINEALFAFNEHLL
ncbi:MAG: macro domain-containing protein [Peptostreptococcaceae bacterium]|nr:macro domain-containing protein [Peptostreptococcaceae bacterium]